MNKETRIMMKHVPTWKAIKMYYEDGKPIVPEHCIVRDGYYLDLFDLDKLPKEDKGVQENEMPELTWSRDDDYALGSVMMQIYEARHKAVENGQDTLAAQLKKSEEWLKLLEHRLAVAGMRPIEKWYSNYKKEDDYEENHV